MAHLKLIKCCLIFGFGLFRCNAHSAGKPTFAVVPPGQCQFNEEWTTVTLDKVEQVSSDTKALTFSTPDKSRPLGLSTCACLLARGGRDADGNPFVRPYTPVSTNAAVGKFELLVKIYPDGNLSGHMDLMEVGDTLEFKHISFNVKKQYPFGCDNIAMLVGGTGITPMVQALHAILGNKNDATKVSMLYGSRRSDQILCEETLSDWQKRNPGRLAVTHVVSDEPVKKGIVKWISAVLRLIKTMASKIPFVPVKLPPGSSWKGKRGHIAKELIKEYFPSPDSDVNIFVCGPPAMYNALCGPREDNEIGGILAEMGYTKEQVTKF